MIIHVYSPCVGGSSDSDGELSPEQRERMTAAIAAELVRMRDAAVAAGVPPEVVAAAMEERRRALAESASGSEDVEDRGADPLDHGGIGH
jgi:hypothetical protein